jgi:hypothetical protein
MINRVFTKRVARAGRAWGLGLAAVLLAAPAFAAEEPVTFPSGSEKASGFLVTPAGKGPWPAVIVIQEWWGLNDWVKDQARALAKEGYAALAVGPLPRQGHRQPGRSASADERLGRPTGPCAT